MRILHALVIARTTKYIFILFNKAIKPYLKWLERLKRHLEINHLDGKGDNFLFKGGRVSLPKALFTLRRPEHWDWSQRLKTGPSSKTMLGQIQIPWSLIGL